MTDTVPLQTKEERVKSRLEALPSDMAKGQRALEALSAYRAARLLVPDEVLRAIDDCYRNFISGKPVAHRTEVEYQLPSPLTLGEAFGVPDIKGGIKTALKRKRLALAGPLLVGLFTGQGNANLPRTKEGYQAAATKLRLTPKEVEAWVSKYLSKRRQKVTLD